MAQKVELHLFVAPLEPGNLDPETDYLHTPFRKEVLGVETGQNRTAPAFAAVLQAEARLNMAVHWRPFKITTTIR